jgi:hypothetical protein
VAIRQTANGLAWYVRRSSDSALKAFQFGANFDKPVFGDFDGDGATDVAVTRSTPQGLVWHKKYLLISLLIGAANRLAAEKFKEKNNK